MTSVLLLSFLLVLSGPALEGCQSASVGDTSGAKPPENAEHDRVYKNAGKLSDKDPGHRFDDYGVGAEDAHEFDDLDPEESKRRLSIIVDKIDNDKDGLVTLEDVERQWVQHNQDGKDAIGWEEYRTLVYGFLDDNTEEHDVSEEDNESYRKMEVRDKRRWGLAA